jgi:hypothetical protein
MQSRDEGKALVRFMVGASRASLGDFYLARLNRSADLERELRGQLHTLAEELAWVYLARLLREHGEEIAELLGSPRRRRLR